MLLYIVFCHLHDYVSWKSWLRIKSIIFRLSPHPLWEKQLSKRQHVTETSLYYGSGNIGRQLVREHWDVGSGPLNFIVQMEMLSVLRKYILNSKKADTRVH